MQEFTHLICIGLKISHLSTNHDTGPPIRLKLYYPTNFGSMLTNIYCLRIPLLVYELKIPLDIYVIKVRGFDF